MLINKTILLSIIKTIPATVSEDKINYFIRESERMDISKILGAELLNDLNSELEESPALSTQSLYDLYHGCTWQSGSVKYNFDGLKTIMAYTTWFRLIREYSYNPTAFGLVIKSTEFSEPMSDQQINSYVGIAREKYLYYIDELKKFLCCNSSNYTQRQGLQNMRRIKFKAVGE